MPTRSAFRTAGLPRKRRASQNDPAAHGAGDRMPNSSVAASANISTAAVCGAGSDDLPPNSVASGSSAPAAAASAASDPYAQTLAEYVAAAALLPASPTTADPTLASSVGGPSPSPSGASAQTSPPRRRTTLTVAELTAAIQRTVECESRVMVRLDDARRDVLERSPGPCHAPAGARPAALQATGSSPLGNTRHLLESMETCVQLLRAAAAADVPLIKSCLPPGLPSVRAGAKEAGSFQLTAADEVAQVSLLVASTSDMLCECQLYREYYQHLAAAGAPGAAGEDPAEVEKARELTATAAALHPLLAWGSLVASESVRRHRGANGGVDADPSGTDAVDERRRISALEKEFWSCVWRPSAFCSNARARISANAGGGAGDGAAPVMKECLHLFLAARSEEERVREFLERHRGGAGAPLSEFAERVVARLHDAGWKAAKSLLLGTYLGLNGALPETMEEALRTAHVLLSPEAADAAAAAVLSRNKAAHPDRAAPLNPDSPSLYDDRRVHQLRRQTLFAIVRHNLGIVCAAAKPHESRAFFAAAARACKEVERMADETHDNHTDILATPYEAGTVTAAVRCAQCLQHCIATFEQQQQLSQQTDTDGSTTDSAKRSKKLSGTNQKPSSAAAAAPTGQTRQGCSSSSGEQLSRAPPQLPKLSHFTTPSTITVPPSSSSAPAAAPLSSSGMYVLGAADVQDDEYPLHQSVPHGAASGPSSAARSEGSSNSNRNNSNNNRPPTFGTRLLAALQASSSNTNANNNRAASPFSSAASSAPVSRPGTRGSHTASRPTTLGAAANTYNGGAGEAQRRSVRAESANPFRPNTRDSRTAFLRTCHRLQDPADAFKLKGPPAPPPPLPVSLGRPTTSSTAAPQKRPGGNNGQRGNGNGDGKRGAAAKSFAAPSLPLPVLLQAPPPRSVPRGGRAHPSVSHNIYNGESVPFAAPPTRAGAVVLPPSSASMAPSTAESGRESWEGLPALPDSTAGFPLGVPADSGSAASFANAGSRASSHTDSPGADAVEPSSRAPHTGDERIDRLSRQHRWRSRAALTIQCCWRSYLARRERHRREQRRLAYAHYIQKSAALCFIGFLQSVVLRRKLREHRRQQQSHQLQGSVPAADLEVSRRAAEERRRLRAVQTIERSYMAHRRRTGRPTLYAATAGQAAAQAAPRTAGAYADDTEAKDRERRMSAVLARHKRAVESVEAAERREALQESEAAARGALEEEEEIDLNVVLKDVVRDRGQAKQQERSHSVPGASASSDDAGAESRPSLDDQRSPNTAELDADNTHPHQIRKRHRYSQQAGGSPSDGHLSSSLRGRGDAASPNGGGAKTVRFSPQTEVISPGDRYDDGGAVYSSASDADGEESGGDDDNDNTGGPLSHKQGTDPFIGAESPLGVPPDPPGRPSKQDPYYRYGRDRYVASGAFAGSAAEDDDDADDPYVSHSRSRGGGGDEADDLEEQDLVHAPRLVVEVRNSAPAINIRVESSASISPAEEDDDNPLGSTRGSFDFRYLRQTQEYPLSADVVGCGAAGSPRRRSSDGDGDEEPQGEPPMRPCDGGAVSPMYVRVKRGSSLHGLAGGAAPVRVPSSVFARGSQDAAAPPPPGRQETVPRAPPALSSAAIGRGTPDMSAVTGPGDDEGGGAASLPSPIVTKAIDDSLVAARIAAAAATAAAAADGSGGEPAAGGTLSVEDAVLLQSLNPSVRSPPLPSPLSPVRVDADAGDGRDGFTDPLAPPSPPAPSSFFSAEEPLPQVYSQLYREHFGPSAAAPESDAGGSSAPGPQPRSHGPYNRHVSRQAAAAGGDGDGDEFFRALHSLHLWDYQCRRGCSRREAEEREVLGRLFAIETRRMRRETVLSRDGSEDSSDADLPPHMEAVLERMQRERAGLPAPDDAY